MKRKEHCRSVPKGAPRAVSSVGRAQGSPPARPAYPRARDAADLVERGARDLGRMLRDAARPLVGATAASLLFGAMMWGCMPVVRPETMPERTPATEMLDEQEQGSADAQSATEPPPKR